MPPQGRLLVVDDEPFARQVLRRFLEAGGYSVVEAATLAEARRVLSEGPEPLAILLDVLLEGENGIDFLEVYRASGGLVPVLVTTSLDDVETAVRAMKGGANDFLVKPVPPERLLTAVANAVERGQLLLENRSLRRRVREEAFFRTLVGESAAMARLREEMERVVETDVSVCILGETGTGKELVARALHRFGTHPSGPFVPVHCGAIPDTLLESELFGHRRGAFTDASRDRRGALALADGGTLFLDEVGEVSPAFQVKLLRFLEDGVVTPLGAEQGEPVEVRVVAATHRDLRDMVAQGLFRQDLYYRLAGYEIRIPPLRERLADLPALVAHVLRAASREVDQPVPLAPSAAVLERLAAHPWPGNVRELAHVVRRLLIDSGGLEDPEAVKEALGEDEPAGAGPAVLKGVVPVVPVSASRLPLGEAERLHILSVLESTGGNKSEAARLLGIDRKTLARKLVLDRGPETSGSEGGHT